MDDRIVGALILIGSLAGICVYFWLIFLAPMTWAWLVIQISAMTAVGGILLILAWIGYTIASTPPPVPIEDLDIDLNDSNKDDDLGEDDSSSNEEPVSD